MKFKVQATGTWKYVRVEDNISGNPEAFNGDATTAQDVEVSTGGGSTGSISIWARASQQTNGEQFVARRPIREGDEVKVVYAPPS